MNSIQIYTSYIQLRVTYNHLGSCTYLFYILNSTTTTIDQADRLRHTSPPSQLTRTTPSTDKTSVPVTPPIAHSATTHDEQNQ